MKTIPEIAEWRRGNHQQFGDPAASVGQAFVRYIAQLPPQPEPVDLIATYEDDCLAVAFEPGRLMPLAVDPEGPVIDEETGALTAFGLRKICPGLWTLTPSLNIPGAIHVFVTLYAVPEPAPWESRIVVVSSLSQINVR